MPLLSTIKAFVSSQKDFNLLAIYGTTASGKSSLAIQLAQEFDGEIISVDSRMIWKGALIGTATPTAEEMQGIPHFGIEIVGPQEDFDLKDFQKYAYKTIQDIQSRGKIPILVGGTNLYMDAVVEGYQPIEYSITDEQSHYLHSLSSEQQLDLLQQLDLETYNSVDHDNPRHYLRKLEYCYSTGNPYPQQKSSPPAFIIPLSLCLQKNTEQVDQDIAERIDEMLEMGLVEETQRLMSLYSGDHQLFTSIGYRQVREHLEGRRTFEEMKEDLYIATRRLAKRQRTWLRKKENIQFFSANVAE